jgi:hypothetical protein
MSTNNGVRKEVMVNPINLSRVYKSDFQKDGTVTAELKQIITTMSYYPGKSVTSNMQGNIFGASDFGFSEQKFENKETRVAWIDVPANSTEETVKAQLAKFPKACIYKTLANKPIITNNQAYAISIGQRTMDQFADNQVVRFGQGNAKEGQLATDANGKVQYRAVFFSPDHISDMDERNADKQDYFASVDIALELGDTEIMVNPILEGNQQFAG